MPVYVCIAKCSDGSYYTGTSRKSLEDRINEHNAGRFPGYTSTRRPVSLVFSEEFQRIDDAISAEQQIKKWSRAKKEALVKRDCELLQELSKRHKRNKN